MQWIGGFKACSSLRLAGGVHGGRVIKALIGVPPACSGGRDSMAPDRSILFIPAQLSGLIASACFRLIPAPNISSLIFIFKVRSGL